MTTEEIRTLFESLGCALPSDVPPVRVLGIDLGTTNSVAAELSFPPADGNAAGARAVEVEQATPEGTYTHVLLPSMVALHGGTTWVGEGAKSLRSRASSLGLHPNQNLFYECKNDMGLRKTYPLASEGFRSAAEIGGHVLSALRSAAPDDLPPCDRVVVTVPASFTVPQRNDTLKAAGLAGLELTEGDLLDEPLAAFLDYLATHREALAARLVAPRTLLVFDFGGGTCDVAVFRLLPATAGTGLRIETLAVSRYHRLGGGDVDAAVFYDVLLPQLQAQNGIGPRDLAFEDKKRVLEPAFLGIAEALKIGLCVEIRRLQSFGKYDGADKAAIRKTQPGAHTVTLGGKTLRLAQPSLSAEQFEQLLVPFLSLDAVGARETEYRTTSSIFGPLQDAIDRAGIAPDQVDLCLLVGGSSLIPQIPAAIGKHLARAEVLTYEERDDVKACVARGAAYHALALATLGRPLVQPVVGDDVLVRHQGGTIPLLKRGTPLPWPQGTKYAVLDGIAFPNDVGEGTARVRLEASDEGGARVLFSQTAEIRGPVARGDPMRVEFRMDSNQILRLRVGRSSGGEVWTATIENPLMNVVTPHGPRMRIEEMEEALRTRQVATPAVPEHLKGIAVLYAEIGQREKAVAYLRRSIRMAHVAPADALNSLARLYGEMGDTEREQQTFEEALRVSPWMGTRFNYALALRRRGLLKEALEVLEPALRENEEPPYFVLAGIVQRVLLGKEAAEPVLRNAMLRFEPPPLIDDWQLNWLTNACELLGEERRLAECREERQRRARGRDHPLTAPDAAALPIARASGGGGS
jgi:molecular chaperone DnaK